MAVNIITAANSLTSRLQDNDDNAFLLIKEDGYIVSTITNESAYYAIGAAVNATIEGSLISQYANGMYLFGTGGNDVLISEAGVVKGGTNGIRMDGDNNVINNAGQIAGSSDYVDSFTSYGIYFDASSNEVKNSGTISGYYAIGSDVGSLTVRNSGTLVADSGYALVSSGYTYFENIGKIDGGLYDYTSLTVYNAGLIDGAIYGCVTSGYLNVTNNGTITGSISGGALYDYVANYGDVGSIGLSDGGDSIYNYGVVRGYISVSGFTAGSDDDFILNAGTVTSAVYTGIGNDTVDSSNGKILGTTSLGDGVDTYSGGDGTDRVDGGAGADTIDLGAGRDIYFAQNADGKDDLDGGDGIDTYDASNATLSVSIDLSASTTALTVGNDTVLNFENIIGGTANDTLTGSEDDNRINGGAGGDFINSAAGNDRILGGDGADTITGGTGRDVMAGGTATGLNSSDKFVFADGDSGATSKTRDVITDFTDHGSTSAPFATGADVIDLHLIDANSTNGGNQVFSFNATGGAAFSGVAGSLIWQQTSTFALVLGDTDGDGKADFVIQLAGVHNLLASDFVL